MSERPHHRAAAVIPGGVVLAVLVVVVVGCCALAGPWIAPESPFTQRLALGSQPPSAEHPAGTDLLGRDVLSRVVFGARTALVGPAIVAAAALAIATVLGLLSGYFGGLVDAVISRWADFMIALPAPLVAVVVVGVAGGGYLTAVLVLVVLFAPADVRIVRGAVIEQRALPYIEAARTLGVTKSRIVAVHILPNVLPLVLACLLLDFVFALISIAGLSFLGLGVAPGTPDWGRMLYENRTLLFSNPAASLLPAAMIVLTAVSVNLIGDWMVGRLAA